ncbi:hypothetical protein JSY14_06940 [Brachybacterium sp. EF45031]|uniref:hypothetical protein n=1 Tax=Brachybacterium sillae TaxID=2810536 RepID=UPI00217E4733|nr:hypothetical protein [Brachybacterium sillae]MCS6711770.1 hypothetical protein [Brachybacterium sillae]
MDSQEARMRLEAAMSATAAVRRTGITRSVSETEMVTDCLDLGERVEALVYCRLQRDTYPLLVATNRRVLHTRRRTFGRWKILAQIPGAEVAGAEIRTVKRSRRLVVRSTRGPHLEITPEPGQDLDQFVHTLERLLGRA